VRMRKEENDEGGKREVQERIKLITGVMFVFFFFLWFLLLFVFFFPPWAVAEEILSCRPCC